MISDNLGAGDYPSEDERMGVRVISPVQHAREQAAHQQWLHEHQGHHEHHGHHHHHHHGHHHHDHHHHDAHGGHHEHGHPHHVPRDVAQGASSAAPDQATSVANAALQSYATSSASYHKDVNQTPQGGLGTDVNSNTANVNAIAEAATGANVGDGTDRSSGGQAGGAGGGGTTQASDEPSPASALDTAEEEVAALERILGSMNPAASTAQQHQQNAQNEAAAAQQQQQFQQQQNQNFQQQQSQNYDNVPPQATNQSMTGTTTAQTPSATQGRPSAAQLGYPTGKTGGLEPAFSPAHVSSARVSTVLGKVEQQLASKMFNARKDIGKSSVEHEQYVQANSNGRGRTPDNIRTRRKKEASRNKPGSGIGGELQESPTLGGGFLAENRQNRGTSSHVGRPPKVGGVNAGHLGSPREKLGAHRRLRSELDERPQFLLAGGTPGHKSFHRPKKGQMYDIQAAKESAEMARRRTLEARKKRAQLRGQDLHIDHHASHHMADEVDHATHAHNYHYWHSPEEKMALTAARS